MSFTFVHAADIHLDSPMEGLSADTNQAPAVAEAAREATFVVFDRIIETCIEETADFLLLSGDIYDREYRSVRAQLHVYDGLCRLAARGIRSFIIHGNHDPVLSQAAGLDWPAEVTTFGSEEVETCEFPSAEGLPVTVSGISYRSADEARKLHRKFQQPQSPGYHVAMLHCTLSSHRGPASYCECTQSDLRSRGFDYWALGHVHSRAVLADSPPCVVYPGNPQGRNSRETGARGCMIVRTAAGDPEPELEFRALDVVRWARADVSMDNVETLDQAEQALLRQCETLRSEAGGSQVICRLRLCGHSPLFHPLCKPDTLRDLTNRAREQVGQAAPFVWLEKLEASVRPPLDLASRAKEEDLLGEVLRYAQSLESSEGTVEILSDACSELLQHTRMSKAVDPPSEEEWAEILDQARLLCVDLLESAEPE